MFARDGTAIQKEQLVSVHSGMLSSAFGISSPTTSLIRHSTRWRPPESNGKTIPAELTNSGANEVDGSTAYFDPTSPLFDPSRNLNAARAIGHAVCRSLPPGSFHYWPDSLDNARLVAFYCQCAVGRAADDPDADAADYYGTKDELKNQSQMAQGASSTVRGVCPM